jgi:hypothetical protein
MHRWIDRSSSHWNHRLFGMERRRSTDRVAEGSSPDSSGNSSPGSDQPVDEETGHPPGGHRSGPGGRPPGTDRRSRSGSPVLRMSAAPSVPGDHGHRALVLRDRRRDRRIERGDPAPSSGTPSPPAWSDLPSEVLLEFSPRLPPGRGRLHSAAGGSVRPPGHPGDSHLPAQESATGCRGGPGRHPWPPMRPWSRSPANQRRRPPRAGRGPIGARWSERLAAAGPGRSPDPRGHRPPFRPPSPTLSTNGARISICSPRPGSARSAP